MIIFTSNPYFYPENTSGAIVARFPHQVPSIFSLSMTLAKPKSPILQIPSLIRILAHLKSRWTDFI